MNRNASPAVICLVNVAAGLAFAHLGPARWLWERIDHSPWRTGPTWSAVLFYLAIYWSGWLLINALLVQGPGAGRRFASMTDFAARALIGSCILVAIQVLMPAIWLVVALLLLLIFTLIDRFLARRPLPRAITFFAWSGAGLALATLIIHPYFVGLPLFIVRLTILMTLWDWLGIRLGVTPHQTRLIPSLYHPTATVQAAVPDASRQTASSRHT